MEKEYFFVVNPRSANGRTGRWWQTVLPRLTVAGLDYAWSFTTGPETAGPLAAKAAGEGFRAVVAVGGDGTAYEVVNGLVAEDHLLSPGCAMAIWPRGTGSDLARKICLPHDDQIFIDMLVRRHTLRMDVGRADFIDWQGQESCRCFLNVAEAGLGGETVSRVNRTSKFFGGFLSFLWGSFFSILEFRNKEMRVWADDRQVHQGSCVLVACGNGSSFGGGMKICPEAALDDGWFDFTGITGTDKGTLLRNLYRVYRGSHLQLPVVWHGRCQKLRIESPERVMVNLDGEQPGVVPATFRILPQLLDMIVPENS